MISNCLLYIYIYTSTSTYIIQIPDELLIYTYIYIYIYIYILCGNSSKDVHINVKRALLTSCRLITLRNVRYNSQSISLYHITLGALSTEII